MLLINDTLDAFDLEDALNAISPERRAYALGYRFERDRRQSVAVYLLLKEALRKGYGIAENPRLVRTPNGKPGLADHPDIHFSFSHCPKAAACVVSDVPVGIDVEEIAAVDWEVARRVLSDAELAEVRSSSEPEVSFARLWTRKEALVKMTGEGLDDGRLPDLLAHAADCLFETTVNRARGYAVTTARRDGEPSHRRESGRIWKRAVSFLFGILPCLVLAAGIGADSAGDGNARQARGRIVRTLSEVARDREPEGLSSISAIGGDRYWCVNDRGGRLHEMEITLSPSGRVETCRMVRSVRLAGRRDLEGGAVDPLDGRIWVSDEADTSVRQFDPQTGVETASVEIPSVVRANVVANRSFEALAISPDGRRLYVANEDTLACDGPVSSRKNGGLVRILEYRRKNAKDKWTLFGGYRYRTVRVAGGPYGGQAFSGVVAMVATKSGALYVLEREMSMKNPLFPTLRAILTEIHPTGPDGCEPAKRELWRQDTGFANYEGMCVGPELPDGTPTLILVSDGGGPAAERILVLGFLKTARE